MKLISKDIMKQRGSAQQHVWLKILSVLAITGTPASFSTLSLILFFTPSFTLRYQVLRSNLSLPLDGFYPSDLQSVVIGNCQRG
ncbi:hypothetical protein XELAEV_18025971mg [Xenopus laevis]|uniref:Uncharacterized protein n=1 Tax=Xenopus laevis TaxID=8355 RepID=A0A974D0K6_XENLA|nr:hypothetical protein XELAEV_18025971mg [Xenopus laevis]